MSEPKPIYEREPRFKMDSGNIAGLCFMVLGLFLWGWITIHYWHWTLPCGVGLIIGWLIASLCASSKTESLTRDIAVMKKYLRDHEIRLPKLEVDGF